MTQTAPTKADPYISLDIFSRLAWQSGDVVVSAGSKQGTTWLLNIVHQLRTGGDDSFECLTEECPVLERPDYPGQPDQERLEIWQQGVFQKYPFRIFKTHVAPPKLPLQPEVKYIIPVRNGKDALVSFYFFWQSMTEEHQAIWGERAARYASLSDCFDHYLVEQRYWKFVNAWLPHRQATNVLLLHYADLKADLAGNARRVADFLGLLPSAEQWTDILEKSGFEWMRANTAKFDTRTVTSRVKRFKEGSMTRKGTVGDHKEWLTPEQEARWQTLHEQMIPDAGLRTWCDQGGRL